MAYPSSSPPRKEGCSGFEADDAQTVCQIGNCSTKSGKSPLAASLRAMNTKIWAAYTIRHNFRGRETQRQLRAVSPSHISLRRITTPVMAKATITPCKSTESQYKQGLDVLDFVHLVKVYRSGLFRKLWCGGVRIAKCLSSGYGSECVRIRSDPFVRGQFCL
jgi:hypothetical protein